MVLLKNKKGWMLLAYAEQTKTIVKNLLFVENYGTKLSKLKDIYYQGQ